MTKAISGRGELKRHEEVFLWVVEFQVGLVQPTIALLADMRHHLVQNFPGDDRGQKVIQYRPLVMESDLALNLRKSPIGVVGRELVVKAVKKALKLGDDDVLIVSRVANDCPPSVCLGGVDLAARQISRPGIGCSTGQLATQDEAP